MIVTISRAARERILTEAADSPETEICGLLFGEKSHIAYTQPTANVANNPANSFEIDPATLFTAIRAERSGGAHIIGHYHSHPTGLAQPSMRDAEMALEIGRLWLIVAGDEMGLWRVISPGQLEPVELALASPSPNRH